MVRGTRCLVEEELTLEGSDLVVTKYAVGGSSIWTRG